MSEKTTLQKAAVILAEMFSGSVLNALQSKPPRTFLYCWEKDALDWLREWRKTDEQTFICHWTGSYMRHGAPPWKDKETAPQEPKPWSKTTGEPAWRTRT